MHNESTDDQQGEQEESPEQGDFFPGRRTPADSLPDRVDNEQGAGNISPDGGQIVRPILIGDPQGLVPLRGITGVGVTTGQRLRAFSLLLCTGNATTGSAILNTPEGKMLHTEAHPKSAYVPGDESNATWS